VAYVVRLGKSSPATATSAQMKTHGARFGRASELRADRTEGAHVYTVFHWRAAVRSVPPLSSRFADAQARPQVGLTMLQENISGERSDLADLVLAPARLAAEAARDFTAALVTYPDVVPYACIYCRACGHDEEVSGLQLARHITEVYVSHIS
jgi:hypothetical protein